MKKLTPINESYVNTFGEQVVVIEYFNYYNCTIKFEDNTILYNKQIGHVKKGYVTNPNSKTVYNIGYLGVGEYNSTNKKIYMTWSDMLKRCYSTKYQIKQSSYIGCFVCDEWLNFQVFAKWFEENYIEGYHLDKDILVKDNKIYSPETCCFVTQQVNNLYRKKYYKS